MQRVEEFEEREEEGRGSLSFRMESPERISAAIDSSVGIGGGDGDGFDFSFVLFPEPGLPPIAADDIFSDGKIRPIYPAFNRDVISAKESAGSELKQPLRMPLRRFFIEEEKEQASFSSSSSSSSMDELEGVPEGTYCVWAPPTNKDRSKTGSSSSSMRWWGLRDLGIGRSQSYGKERFVFIPVEQEKEKEKKETKITGKSKAATEADSAEERRRSMMTMMRKRGRGQGGQKKTVSAGRRSYLPYKPDIVGFFANVNANSLRGPTPF